MRRKRKIDALLKGDGFAASTSTVGRILKRLMERGRIVPVPILRPDKRRFRLRQPQRYAQRPAKGRKTRSPGELVQIDTLFVNLTPGKAIKHSTAYDPVAKWRYEFYASYDLPNRIDKLQPLVDAFARPFNLYRPHQAFGDKTPAAYLKALSSQTRPSHNLDEQNAGGKSRLRLERLNVFRIRPSRWSSLATSTLTSPRIPRPAKSAG